MDTDEGEDHFQECGTLVVIQLQLVKIGEGCVQQSVKPKGGFGIQIQGVRDGLTCEDSLADVELHPFLIILVRDAKAKQVTELHSENQMEIGDSRLHDHEQFDTFAKEFPDADLWCRLEYGFVNKFCQKETLGASVGSGDGLAIGRLEHNRLEDRENLLTAFAFQLQFQYGEWGILRLDGTASAVSRNLDQAGYFSEFFGVDMDELCAVVVGDQAEHNAGGFLCQGEWVCVSCLTFCSLKLPKNGAKISVFTQKVKFFAKNL